MAHGACGLPRLALSSRGVTRGHLAASGDASVVTAEAVGGTPGIQWVEVGMLLGCTWTGPTVKDDPAPNVGRAKVEKHCRPEEHFCFNSRNDLLGEVGGALC